MSSYKTLPFIALMAILLTGCGSGTDVQTPPPQPIVPSPPPGFQTRTDTVSALIRENPKDVLPIEKQPVIRYMIQIGAFRDPQNAGRMQNLARERFDIPVINDFSTDGGLYQIRLGFFENRESAYAFRQKLIKQFPKEYWDAWIVELKD